MEQRTARRELRLWGRQDELALLWSRFEQITASRLHVTPVVDDPVIGKTYLLKEVAGRADKE